MKRTLLLLASCAIFGVAKAEGYQVNLQSARQTSMGHVGVAQKLGAESQFFNPAGMAFMENSIDLSAGFSAIFAKATYTDDAGAKSINNVKASTPMYVYAAFKVNDKFSFGVSMTNPYGSSLDWGKDWVGSGLVQNISLQAFNVQPTAAYKITDKLSFGVGMMISFGNMELSRALMPKGSLTALNPALTQFANVIPVSTTLSGSSTVRMGYNIGLMYDLNNRLTLGASYRSRIDMSIDKGDVELAYADGAKEIIAAGAAGGNELFKTIILMGQSTFSSEMPMPANFTIGASYLLTDKLILAGEVQTVFWHAYDELDIDFSKDDVPNATSAKNYKNTVAIRFGAEYKLNDRTDLRAGIYFDQSPIQDDNYNPETPGMNKIGTSVGCSYRPMEGLSIDFAFLYIAGLGRDGSIANANPFNPSGVFAGKYTNHAVAPTLGVSYSF